MARWSVFPDGDEPARAVTALAEQVERDGGRALAIYRDPVGEHWQIFCLLPTGQGRAHAVPARPLADPREAAAGGREEDRPLRRSDRRDVAQAGPLLDAERQPPARGARQAQGRDDPRHPRPRARGRVPDPRAQHGEGAQPQGKGPRGDPHVPGPRPRRAASRGGRLRVSVRVAPLHHARPPLRGQCALRGRGLRADPAPRRQVPEGPLPEDVDGARGARRAGARGRRRARRWSWPS